MKYNYTLGDYNACIYRELKKREATYPKMIAKQEKLGIEDKELAKTLDDQILRLRLAWMRLKGFGEENNWRGVTAEMEFPELIREYHMRKRCFPRFILFKRISPEEAAKEMAIWMELCLYFAEKYLGDAAIALSAMETRTRKRKTNEE